MAELRLRPPQPARHAGRADAVASQRRAAPRPLDLRHRGLRGRRAAAPSPPRRRCTTAWSSSRPGTARCMRCARATGRCAGRTTPAAGGFGVQSSATLTPEGRLLVGDSSGTVHCLEAKHGRLLWKATVADTDPERSHIWGSPVVANGRVFVGRASHSDVPCTRGHLYAFDLETGAELWRYATVPERVCRNDTRVECRTADDCGGGGVHPRREWRRHGDGRRRSERRDGLHGIGRLLHLAVDRQLRLAVLARRRHRRGALDLSHAIHRAVQRRSAVQRLRLPERPAAGRRLRRRGRHPAARPRPRARTAPSTPSIP